MNLGIITGSGARTSGLYRYGSNLVSRREVNGNTEPKADGIKAADAGLDVSGSVFTTYRCVVAANARQALSCLVTFEKVLAEAGHHNVDWIG